MCTRFLFEEMSGGGELRRESRMRMNTGKTPKGFDFRVIGEDVARHIRSLSPSIRLNRFLPFKEISISNPLLSWAITLDSIQPGRIN